MRLLLATYFGLSTGGLGHVMRSLGRRLAELGASVGLLGAGEPEVTLLQPPLYPRRTLRRLAILTHILRRAGAAGSFDLVACQDVFALNAALGSGMPAILVLHGFALQEMVGAGHVAPGDRGWRYVRFLERRACRRAPLTVAVSRALAEHASSLGARVVLLPNGVDTHFFCPPEERDRRDLLFRLGLDESAQLVVFAGRLVRIKGVDVLLRALALLPARYILAVAGEGEQAPSLKSLALRLGLTERVLWLGRLDRLQVRLLYQAASAVCLPSLPLHGAVENCSLTLLEAMACGAPVVASAIGGLAENVTDGITGRLVPPGDPRLLAKAIAETAGTELGRAMGERARRWVVANRDEGAWARRFLELAAEVKRGSWALPWPFPTEVTAGVPGDSA